MGIAGTRSTREGIVRRVGYGARKKTGKLQSGSGPLLNFETAFAVAPGDMVEYTVSGEGLATIRKVRSKTRD